MNYTDRKSVWNYAMALLRTNADRVKELKKFISIDLNYGPLEATELAKGEHVNYPGYSKALAELSELTSCLPDTVYYDNFTGEVLESLPEETNDYSELIEVNVRITIFGFFIAQHL